MRILLALLLTLGTAHGQNTTILNGVSSAKGATVIGGVGTAVVLTAITISPPNPVVSFTSMQSFTANGTYSDGSNSDITSTVAWFSSNPLVATNNGPNYQCVARGIITVTASLSGVIGNTTLGCQSPTFSPIGTFNVSQGGSPVTIVQFTGANGSSPFTFSSPDLPAWLSLSNAGCPGIQINCSLIGTPTTVGISTFHIQATDNLGNTACAAPGCLEGVNVTAVSAEDNTYCSLSGSTEVVIGTPYDPPSNPITQCNYTGISFSPLSGTPLVINVCPVGQLDSVGVHDTGCQGAPQPTLHGAVPACTAGNPAYCSTIQGAVNYAYNNGPCGADIQIWPTINDAVPTSAQNVYTEPPVVAPGNINCGPDYSQPWMYIRTRKFASMPPPGNRITPAWVNVTSIPNYPNYSQLSSFGIPNGTYLPQWRCEVLTNEQCIALNSQMISTTVGAILSGVRVMGIQFTAPHGRNVSNDIYGNPVCNQSGYTGNCSPGFVGAMIGLGCNIQNGNFCTTASGVQGQPPAAPTGTGSQHVIIDRVIVMGCDDPTMTTCYDDASNLIGPQNGQHISIIDSYLVGGYCMYAIGPCVEAKAISGGNPQMSIPDIGFKIVNNFLVGSGENWFFGGGTATSNAIGVEIRRNHMFKPLTWKIDSNVFVGGIYNAWVNKGGAGYSNATTCQIAAPAISGTQATCTAVVSGGAITDVLITGQGSGYGIQLKGIGKTAAAGNTLVQFTDGGVTYASCKSQLNGDVTTFGSTDVQWADGNKFTTLMNGTQITINNINYTVATVNSKTDLTTTSSVPSSGATTFSYNSNFPSRGDCVYVTNGVPDVKNMGEFKNGVQAIIEGNIAENNWVGQSDQSGFGFLITPKNANNLCPVCQVTDLTFRYNFYRNMNHGIQIAGVNATQCSSSSCLPQALTRLSIHDNIFDNLDGVYWTAGTSPISGDADSCFEVENVQSQPLATSFVTFNHNACIQTLPTGYSLTGGSFMSVFYNLPNGTTPSLMTNIIVTNDIGGGGVKNQGSHNTGQANCLNNACTDQAGHGPTETALRQAMVNSFIDPITGGTFSTGQFHTVQITAGGTCTTPPTGYTLSGGGGTGGSLAFNTSTTAGKAITKMWIVNVGQGYTSTPIVNFTGGVCSVNPTVTLFIVGPGINATSPDSVGCFDHNIMPLQAWNGLTPMTPYPTTQLDATNNCVSASGGHNNTQAGSTTLYNVCNGVAGAAGSGPCSWEDLSFTTWFRDSLQAEPVGITPNLHLQASSLGHNAANDGTDIGPNVTLVLGCQVGVDAGCSSVNTVSPYTGITINSGVAVLPQ